MIRGDGNARRLIGLTAVLLVAWTGLTMATPHAVYAAPQTRVRTTAADEFNGFSGSGFLGWTQNSQRHPNSYQLFLRDPGGNTIRVNRPGTQGLGGGIDGTTVVYEEVTRTRNRLVLYDTAARSHTGTPITDSAKANMHPTISGEWLLYTKGVRGKRTSVHLYQRSTGEVRQLSTTSGARRYVYSGQVAGNWAVWGRVSHVQDVFRTNLATRQTIKIARRRGVRFQYDPVVTPTGTVFFQRSKPCVRRCPKLNTPAAVNQLIEQRPGARQRVVVTLRKGQDGGYMYAAPRGDRTTVLYNRFSWLGHGDVSYSDIFAFTGSR